MVPGDIQWCTAWAGTEVGLAVRESLGNRERGRPPCQATGKELQAHCEWVVRLAQSGGVQGVN